MEESKAKELLGKRVSYTQGRGTSSGKVTKVEGTKLTIDNGKTEVTRKADLVRVIE